MAQRKTTEETTDQSYWSEYTNLQFIKHQLLKKYLDAWFPILSKFNGQVSYVESHAGRGKHIRGEPGSPIVALKSLLDHHYRDEILKNSSVGFYFIEKYSDSVKDLKDEIANLGELPKNVSYSIIQEDHEKVFQDICDRLDESPGAQLTPSFIFYDPYSFLMPVDKMTRLLQKSKCEILINFMWRYLNLAINNEQPGQVERLNSMFGDESWRNLRDVPKESRCDATLLLLKEKFKADHMWSVKMYDKKNVLKYVLVHFSNHPTAFNKMKDAAWSLAEHGDFRFWQSDDPNQETLLVAKPNLKPLHDAVLKKYGANQVHLHDTYEVVDLSPFRKPHYHSLLRELYKSKNLILHDQDKLVFSKNPLISFV